MPIPWTDKEKKSLQPTRAFGAVAPTARSLKALRKVFRASGPSRDRLTTYRRGVKTTVEPELAPLRVAALKLIEDVDLDAIKLATIEELAAAEAMFALGHGFPTLTNAVVLARGVADALTVRLRCCAFGIDAEPNWTVAAFLISTPRRHRHNNPRFWLPMRHAICTATPDEYEAAKKVALDAWDELSAEEKANVAYVFPDELWGTEILSSPAGATTQRGAYGGMPNQVQAYGFLLSTCQDAKVAKAHFEQGGTYWVSQCALELTLLLQAKDAAELFMDVIPTLLIKKKYQTFHKTPPRDVLRALMKIDDERIPAFVATYVGHKVLGAQAALYFQECPEARGVLEKGNASARSLFDSLGQTQQDATKAASDSDVPGILREHSWRRPKGKKKQALVPGLTITSSSEEHVLLPEGVHPLSHGPMKLPPLDGEELEKWRESVARGRAPVDSEYKRSNYRVHYSLPPEEALAAWNEGRGYVRFVLRFVAEHGLACVPGFIRGKRLNYLDYEGAEEWITAYESFDSPRVAPLWARVFSGRKKWRPAARKWLRGDARRAADGLVPAAFGAKGREKKDAEAALRDLVLAGEEPALRAAAAAYGVDAKAAMETFLARDPLVVDAKPPKLPSFLNAAHLPPLLVDGRHLSDEARAAFIELLSVAEADYPGYAQIREGLDAASLARFVLELLDMWARQGGPGRHDWMLRAALAFPSTAVVRAVCDHARAWARSKGAAAQRACAALAYLGSVHESDAAALHLAHIAATTRFVALKREAAEHLQNIAAARGLTRDELDDRSTPDLGLDERGQLSLSFGEVHLSVEPNESLGVILRKDDEVIRSFPRLGKSASDEEKAARKKAKARYDAFKKDLAAISKRQLQRLDSSMSSGRAWSLEDAKRYFFDHPLAQHLARGLVWLSDEDVAFRLTRDGTFADAGDDEVSVRGSVRIAHVLELKDAEAWIGVFSDYEILQPILQLGRPKEAFTKTERKSAQVKRYAGTKVKAAKVFGFLESRGWQRDSSSHISAFSKTGREGTTFKLRLEGSIEMEYLSSGEKVEIGVLSVETRTKEGASVVSVSEVLYDLASLCA